MNPDAKKWLFICLAFAASVIGTGFLLFSRGQKYGQGITKKQYQDSMKLYKRDFDSLQRQVDFKTARLEGLARQRDTINARDSLYKAQLVAVAHDYNTILKKYNALHSYDTLSRGDILRYVSDSLPAR